MSENLPPLVFEPRLVPKIWGGDRLEKLLGKRPGSGGGGVGESWEIFDFPPGYVEGNREWISAVVAGGALKGKTLHELMGTHAESVLGKVKPVETSAGRQFPLLIKFLDAREDLSIQVHPTPGYAEKHPEAHLKTECWIILDADKGAKLYKGLKPGVTREGFAAAVKSGTVAEQIATVPARVGDCHFLPSGAVHALGAGTLVAEVQTPSDTTYRVYDFDRVEAATGKKRKLHLEEAMECIDFGHAPLPAVTSMRNTAVPLVTCDYFSTTTINAAAHSVRAVPAGEIKIWMVVDGGMKLQWSGDGGGQLQLRKGQTALLPARLVGGLIATFGTNCTYLETVVP